MRLTGIPLLAVFAASAMVSCSSAAGHPPHSTPAVQEWRADHHMHLGSADICERLGDCIETNQPPAILAEDIIAALDSGPVQSGVVISSAYLYGLDDLGLDDAKAAGWMRRENEFTAAEVQAYGSRLVGILSVDPLLPDAVGEIRYWRGSAELVGLKLHLSASAVDLHSTAHVKQLLAVVAQAAEQELPLLVHIGGGEFDGRDAEILIREVLPATSPSWVQIAHAGGGWPFVDNHHNEVLRQFAEHIERGDAATRKVLFDLSYVPAEEHSGEQLSQLVQLMRRIGLQRFLFGSDFNVLTPGQQMDALQRLDLSAGEMSVLRNNCAPWVCSQTPEAPKGQ